MLPDIPPQTVDQAVGVFGHAPKTVQIALVIGCVVLGLAGIAAWYFRRRDGDTVPASVLVSITEEFSRQVGHMATVVEGMHSVVEEMRDTITGCQTCPFHPNAKKD